MLNKDKSYPYKGDMTRAEKQIMIIQMDSNGTRVECRWLEGSLWLPIGSVNGGHMFNFQEMEYRVQYEAGSIDPYYITYNLEDTTNE
jgi:hypothetical protein